MKCKFLKIVFVVAIAMMGGINVFNAQESEKLSEIAMANVDALAQNARSYDFWCPYEGNGCKLKYSNGTVEIVWGKNPNADVDIDIPGDEE